MPILERRFAFLLVVEKVFDRDLKGRAILRFDGMEVAVDIVDNHHIPVAFPVPMDFQPRLFLVLHLGLLDEERVYPFHHPSGGA